MEQITHRVHEHDPGLSPTARDAERVLVDGDREARSGSPRVPVVLVFAFPIAFSRLDRVSA